MPKIVSLLALGLALTACQLDLPSGSSGTSTDSTSAAGSTGAGGSSGSGSHPCDTKNTCEACQSCALNVQCAAQATACSKNSGCVGIDQCMDFCGSDAECKGQCFLQNPEGELTYRALLACVYCDACPTDCAGYVTCT